MFEALLLSIWYDLSDLKLAEALDDRASFHYFCGFSANVATPERPGCVRYRRLLVLHKLDQLLFDIVTAQLTKPTHPSHSWTDREDLRDVEALLWPAPNAMARSRQAAIQVHLTAIAYNLKRTMNILAAQA